MDDMDIAILVAVGFGFLVLILSIVMARAISKAKKKEKGARQQKMDDKQACASGSFSHVAGLPIAENTICELFYCPEKIEINANGTAFNLDLSKLTDISMKTDTEIQQHYVSSAGGAVGGALLFGPVGAMIGGRAQEKQTKETHTYLFLTYTKDDSVDYIAFDVTQQPFQAQHFVKEFQKRPRLHQPQAFEL